MTKHESMAQDILLYIYACKKKETLLALE